VRRIHREPLDVAFACHPVVANDVGAGRERQRDRARIRVDLTDGSAQVERRKVDRLLVHGVHTESQSCD
jgi:hypothetical protein